MGGVKHIGQILGHVHVQLVPSARFDPSVQGEVYSPSVHYTPYVPLGSATVLHTTPRYSTLLYFPLLYYILLLLCSILLYLTLLHSTQPVDYFRDTSLLSTHKPLITYTYLTYNLLYIISPPLKAYISITSSLYPTDIPIINH